MTATIAVDTREVVGTVNPRLFGGFAEHLGRVIYGGLFDPVSPQSDADGLRRDVFDALKQLDFTILRYPGGNFVSGYHWRDGVGPLESRKTVLDAAWNSSDPNTFGTDEFLTLAAKMDWEPMIAVNLGNGDAEEAAAWVEYCSRHRPRVKVWCLGNEMDGDWQIGHTPAWGYIERARAAAEKMREVDPNIELVVCGSSNPSMSTWLEWDRAVLEGLGEYADYISLHRYANKADGAPEDYLAFPNSVDRQIEEIDQVCRDVAARSKNQRRAFLCFDEWNVWYRTAFKRFSDGGGAFAPPLLEEKYNLEDALVVAGFLNSFVRHADVVHIANLAQIVNAIAPIITTEEHLLVQSIFWPFEMFTRRRKGTSLNVDVEAPRFHGTSYGDTHVLDVSSIVDGNRLSLFVVNRDGRPLEVQIRSRNVDLKGVESAESVYGSDLGATNSLAQPNAVAMHPFDAIEMRKSDAVVTLPGHSFTAITFATS